MKKGDRVFVMVDKNPRTGVIRVVNTLYKWDTVYHVQIEDEPTKLVNVGRHDFVCPFPEVGMGVTYGYGADCYPGTITAVSKSGREIQYIPDDYQYTGDSLELGSRGNPDLWVFTPRTGSNPYSVKLRKNGRWGVGGHFSLGHRMFYNDPSF